MDIFNQLMLSIIPGLIIAALTSYFTVHLSLKRFYSERWWERKAQSYSIILESLYKMKAYPTFLLRAIERNKKTSKDLTNGLRLESQKSFNEINKALAIGTFVVSDETTFNLSNSCYAFG